MQSVLLLRNQCICAFGIFREVASGNDLTKFLYVPNSHTLNYVTTSKVLFNSTSLYDNYAHLQAIFSLWIVSIIGRWFRLLTLVYLSKLHLHLVSVGCTSLILCNFLNGKRKFSGLVDV